MKIVTIVAMASFAVTLFLLQQPSDAFAPTMSIKPTINRQGRKSASSSRTSLGAVGDGAAGGKDTTDESSAAIQYTSMRKQLSLYNSLTRTKEAFIPQNPHHVTMYTCGPTVYDYAHVGNFRAFLTYDIIKRTLLYLGYTVDHVCNLTDVDDKIIQRCEKEGLTLLELTRNYESKFFDDLEALNIIKAREYPRATEHIQEMAQFILDLEGNGLAYQSAEGSWYFAVSKKEGYGTRLVQLDPEQLKKGGASSSSSSGDVVMDADEYDAEKEGIRDFCLWKAYKPNFDRDDATWDPVVLLTDGTTKKIGRGRPGWHLECSAMCRKYLGNTIDIHAGGVDLKFPHHENEIAQSEGANCAPFCNCWVHNGFVNIGNEKMSKSKGNFLTLRTTCPTSDDVRAYRYLVVSSQYRNPLSFTDTALNAAKGALKRLDKLKSMLGDALLNDKGVQVAYEGISNITIAVEKELANFDLAIADDLSMPRASACLFSIVKLGENEFKCLSKAVSDDEDDDSTGSAMMSPPDLVGLTSVQRALDKMDQIFGIFYNVSAINGDSDENFPADVMQLVAQRTAAKDSKDWSLADSIRSKITALGFDVKDMKGGDPTITRNDASLVK